MKIYNTKMWAGAALITLFVMAGCAGKDEMGMDQMKKETMASEMTKDSGMKKMDSKIDQEMETMETAMDDSMGSDMKTME